MIWFKPTQLCTWTNQPLKPAAKRSSALLQQSNPFTLLWLKGKTWKIFKSRKKYLFSFACGFFWKLHSKSYHSFVCLFWLLSSNSWNIGCSKLCILVRAWMVLFFNYSRLQFHIGKDFTILLDDIYFIVQLSLRLLVFKMFLLMGSFDCFYTLFLIAWRSIQKTCQDIYI